IGDLMRVRGASRVIDPCCGSGTLLIEAALAARRVAPGIKRRFAAMDWAALPQNLFAEERERARGFELPGREIALRGSDIDAEALRIAEQNAAKAGVGDTLLTKKVDLADFKTDSDGGVVLCNPPYGERLLDVQQAEALYKTMGRVFEKKPGWSYAIISPHDQFEQLFGRKADKRRKLYNGMLKCQLYMYF
ncbi:MAG: N-6 DNA methylase, partial [Oscillospiraceae bacterium]|nr:N-6 DNA methylase [Oscillospiraceae bacterium]